MMAEEEAAMKVRLGIVDAPKPEQTPQQVFNSWSQSYQTELRRAGLMPYQDEYWAKLNPAEAAKKVELGLA